VTRAGVQIRRGSKFELDGELFEVTDFISSAGTYEVVLQGPTSFRRKSVVDLLADPSARLIPDEDGPEPDDPYDPAAIALLGLSPADMKAVREKADHVREVLTGYRSGSPELALDGEPRPEFDPARKLMERYDAKRIELGVGEKTLRRWVSAYKERGEAGLVSRRKLQEPKIDPRWDDVADAIIREHTEESMPTKTAVILQTSARLELLYGEGEVKEPSRSTANRHLLALDEQHPTFRGTTKRNRDIANSPPGQHGKLRPTRPGEYLILDTTRLDVFAFDPATLRWMQVELTAAMDWYTRCIVALRLTPVSTKAVDAAAVMYQVFRPLPAPATWPSDAVWPYHGIPHEVLIDPDKIDRTGRPSMGPALAPDTIVVDHGKIYLSEHLNSVCQRFGISIQPARLREGRDKAPLERFFGTVRTRLLQYLPGYKGPDINARGLDVEGHAFYYINELEAIVREWVARHYHRIPHPSLFDPALPAKQAKDAKMTPAQMYSHGIARAGYVEVPRHPNLALEFLRAEPRTIQAKGVRMHNLIYKGDVLDELRKMKSPYEGRFKDAWPIHVDPDDISRVYVQHPYDREWHELLWEHASKFPMVFSDDALAYARELALQQHGFIDEQFALRELFKRFNLSIELSPKERRIALRMSREEQMLSKQVGTDDAQTVNSLSSLSALTDSGGSPLEFGRDGPEIGDDDDIADIEDDYDDESFDLA
jgi:transposase InsO family protein